MPGRTSPRSYPYPLDSDPINVAGDMMALANAIDDDVTSSLVGKLNTTGGTVTGSLTVNSNLVVKGTSHVTGIATFDSQVKVNDRLDVIADANEGIYVTNANNTPHVTFYDHSNGELHGMIRAASGDFYVQSDNDLFLQANNHTVIAVTNPTSMMVTIGKAAPNPAVAGWEIYGAGNGLGRATATTSHKDSYANFIARHVDVSANGMDNDGSIFVLFQRSATGLTIGSITQVGTTGVKYNTTSDYRIKDDLGPVVNAAERLAALLPKHLRGKADGLEFDGFIAHEVQPYVPEAVTGEKDAVLPPDDEFDPGGPDLQQLDVSRMMPIVVATLQEVLLRVAALETGP